MKYAVLNPLTGMTSPTDSLEEALDWVKLIPGNMLFVNCDFDQVIHLYQGLTPSPRDTQRNFIRYLVDGLVKSAFDADVTPEELIAIGTLASMKLEESIKEGYAKTTICR